MQRLDKRAQSRIFPGSEATLNTQLGLLGTKVGMTQFFNENGDVQRVTAVQAGPCVVVGKRSIEKDGYSALVLGFEERGEKGLTKADLGVFAKAGVKPQRHVCEFRLPEEETAKYELAQVLQPAEVFRVGHFVDIAATSKGRGFAGVMKRHNFAGAATVTHGTHEYKRHGGSIGSNMTPGRTFKGKKMPGHYGNERVTTPNLKVARIDAETGLVFLRGAVPGPKGGLVELRLSVRKTKANNALQD